MSITIRAVYEQGVLRPVKPLPLEDLAIDRFTATEPNWLPKTTAVRDRGCAYTKRPNS
jgi:hypothetical protein